MIEKQIINAGLTKFFPVVVLKGERDQEVIMDRDDYSFFRVHEGMTDREIVNFAGVI